FYVGGYGEYSWANTNGSAVNLATGAAATPVTGNPPNWHGGLQLGFDYMMPSRLLIGVARNGGGGLVEHSIRSYPAYGHVGRPVSGSNWSPAVGLPVANGPRVRSPYSWTGFYFGADGGFAWQRATGTLTTASGAVLTPYGYSGTGPFAGSFVGVNYQFNRFVFGVEGDWQWSNLTGSNQTLAPLGATGALPSGPFTVSTTTKDYGAIRGRLGIAFDRFLVFGTGGWATGNPSTAFALTGAVPFVTTGGKSNGWTAGGGLEYAITDSILGRVEYRYTDLQTSGFA